MWGAGVGPFTAANMLQLLGHFDRVPCDSETIRHLRKVHKLSTCTQANVRELAQQVSVLSHISKMIRKGKERKGIWHMPCSTRSPASPQQLRSFSRSCCCCLHHWYVCNKLAYSFKNKVVHRCTPNMRPTSFWRTGMSFGGSMSH